MPTVSIKTSLARLPGKAEQPDLTWAEVGAHLRDQYLNTLPGHEGREKKRMEKAAERQRLYQSSGEDIMDAMLGMVYDDPDVLKWRRDWVAYAKYNNVLRRVVNEIACCYSQPARRKVGGEDNDRRYQEVQRLSRQHEVMQRINRMGVLHRSVVAWPRMRQRPDGVWVPVIDVVTPARFIAVRDPLDPTQLLALIFENDYAVAQSSFSPPKWSLWTWHEFALIDADGKIMEETVRPHNYGRIPGVLFSLEPPDGCLIDEHTGEDLTAAQRAVWFLVLLHLKEAKSATTQMVITGDLSRAQRDQAQDSQRDFELPAEASAQVHNRGMDFTRFLTDAMRVTEIAAANYGVPPSVLNHTSATSADSRELMRVPLRELRLQQQIALREFERELAEVQALVVKEHRSDLSFSTDGWSVDFADPQTPLGRKERLEVFEHERKMTLKSTVDFKREENPDLSVEAAWDEIFDVIADEYTRNAAMRPLQAIAGTPGATTPEVESAPIDSSTDAEKADVLAQEAA